MRILHVLESFAAGGMETTFLNVLRAFRPAAPWIQHDVLTLAGGPLEARYRAAADQVTVAAHESAIAEVLDTPPDLVHILFERCAYRLLPRIVARCQVPVVYGKGYDMGGMYRLNDGIEWQPDESMLAAVDGATFTTPHLAGGFRLPKGRTTVLRKAAGVSAFTALRLPDFATAPRILCVASLHPRKRIGDLILALRDVRRQVPRAELQIVGDGNPAERERLVTLAADLGLSGAVTLSGTRHDIPAVMSRARVVALPSSCEGVPTALIEGMAAGRPVVATSVGHVSSIVDDGVEGYLVDVGDVPMLAERLTRLFGNRVLARTMGQAARARAVRHDVRVVARLLLDALMAAIPAARDQDPAGFLERRAG